MSIDLDDFSDSFNDMLGGFIDEIDEEGVETDCPNCGTEMLVHKGTNTCPKCGTEFPVKFE